ncbi:MAG: AAA family ATPase [Saprospiraceae bacterium]
MNAVTLDALEAALATSPENQLLREQVLQGCMSLGRYEAARDHASKLLQQGAGSSVKLALAKCYLQLGKASAGVFISEELLQTSEFNGKEIHELRSLHLRLLIADDRKEEAQEQFAMFELVDPEWSDAEMEDDLKVKAFGMPSEEEDDTSLFFEKPDTSFKDVGGMESVKDEIRMKIIAPLANPELFAQYGKKAGGGILLYGPPGCGKTFIARATAGEIDARFMAIDLDDILSMWQGGSEKNLSTRFCAARKHQPVVIFIDEIDALAGKRKESLGGGGMKNTSNTFLKELDGINDANEGLLVLGATNLPWHIDTAFMRPGRFDRIIFVPPPDETARKIIIDLLLSGKPTEKVDTQKIAKKTPGFSGADLTAVVDRAVEGKLAQAMRSGKVEPISTKDLLNAASQTRPSVKDWLNTARNYVLYSNASGMYDDVKAYLKM